MPNAITIIRRDHRAVESFYDRYVASQLVERKEEFCQAICEALTRHAEMEENIFYPAVQKEGGDELRRQTEEFYTAHQEMKTYIEDLEGLDDEVGKMDRQVRLLMSAVERHVEEEENYLLPKVERALGELRLEELGTEMAVFAETRALRQK